MILTREQILEASDRKTEDVPVPEWGGTVRVQSLSGRERDIYEAGLVQLGNDGTVRKVDMANARSRLASLSIVDERGERVFTEEDVEALGEKSAIALERVFDVAARLCGLTEEAIEEMTAGFAGAPSGSSTSA